MTETLIALQSTAAQYHRQTGSQKDDLHEISSHINTAIRSHEALKIAMRQWRNDVTTELREQATRRIASLAAYSEKQFKSTKENFGCKLKEELRELELKRDDEITNVMEQNKEQFHQIRKQCNMTINDNLDIITNLRNEANKLKEEYRFTKKALHDMHNKNKSIVVPLESNKQSLQKLNIDLEAYNKQKQELADQKQKLKNAEEDLKEIEWDYEVLFQKLEGLQKDQLSQKKSFNHSIYSAQQLSNYQNLLLEQRIRKLSNHCNKTTAAITGILQKANIGLDTIQNSKIPITDVVKERNDRVHKLQDELNSLNSAYSRLLESFEATKANAMIA